MKSAIVLLSGGLDSATALAIARSRGFRTFALSVHYGQRHASELKAAERVAAALGAHEHRIMGVDLAGIGGSALTDMAVAVPESTGVALTVGVPATSASAPAGASASADAHASAGASASASIPVTYVPARNTMLLALALGWAEVVGATDIFVGVNSVDYSGYPDCRPQFIEAFQTLAQLATKAGVEGARFTIQAPLIAMSKAEIIRTGTQLGVDYAMTVSCYQADSAGRACGRCDSCRLRAQGFADAGLPDPTVYA